MPAWVTLTFAVRVLVAGSMRASVPPWWVATQIAPPESVIPSGADPGGNWIVASSFPVPASKRRTRSLSKSDAHTDPSPAPRSFDSPVVKGPVRAPVAESTRNGPPDVQTAPFVLVSSPTAGYLV